MCSRWLFIELISFEILVTLATCKKCFFQRKGREEHMLNKLDTQ